MTSLLPIWTRTFDRVRITPVLGASRVAGCEPGLEDGACADNATDRLPLTFWVDRRPIASHWYPIRSYEQLSRGPFFVKPVSMVLLARIPPRPAGWLKISVTAVPSCDTQFYSLLVLFAESGLVLANAGGGRVALPLGHHWLRMPDTLIEAVLADPRPTDLLDRFKRVADEAFRWVLLGDDERAAVQLLESIPGIAGERGEPA